MAHIEVGDEASIHDQLTLEVVPHTEAHAEVHEDVCPVEGACMPLPQSLLPSCKQTLTFMQTDYLDQNMLDLN